MWYDPWPDHFAHFRGPFSDEIIAPSGELARLDYWLSAADGQVYERAGVLSDETDIVRNGGRPRARPRVFRLVSPEALVLDALQARRRAAARDQDLVRRRRGPEAHQRAASRRACAATTSWWLRPPAGNLMLDLFLDQRGPIGSEQPLEAHAAATGGRSPGRSRGRRRQRRPRCRSSSGSARDSSLDYLVVRSERCAAPTAPALRILGPGGQRDSSSRRGDRIHYAAAAGLLGTRSRASILLETSARPSPYAHVQSPEERAPGIAICIDRCVVRAECLERVPAPGAARGGLA